MAQILTAAHPLVNRNVAGTATCHVLTGYRWDLRQNWGSFTIYIYIHVHIYIYIYVYIQIYIYIHINIHIYNMYIFIYIYIYLYIYIFIYIYTCTYIYMYICIYIYIYVLMYTISCGRFPVLYNTLLKRLVAVTCPKRTWSPKVDSKRQAAVQVRYSSWQRSAQDTGDLSISNTHVICSIHNICMHVHVTYQDTA